MKYEKTKSAAQDVWRLDMSRMGLEISKLRKEVGMTQKQLAKLIGVTESFIVEVEAGRRVLNADLSAKISKALRHEVGTLEIYESDEKIYRPEPDKKVEKVIEKPVQAIWNDALAGVLMAVPVYANYKMDKAGEARQLPIISNKVEGFPKDKVFYLTIEDNEMAGFRICRGDLALVVDTREIEKDAIYFIEYDGKKAVRQIRKLDNDKLLLVSNRTGLKTETAFKKDIKTMGRLIRLEIVL